MDNGGKVRAFYERPSGSGFPAVRMWRAMPGTASPQGQKLSWKKKEITLRILQAMAEARTGKGKRGGWGGNSHCSEGRETTWTMYKYP